LNTSKFAKPIRTGSLSSDPSTADNGTAYYNFSLGKWRVKENNVWVDFVTSTVFAAYQTLATTTSRSVAYIRDLKASGTASGTFTSGAWQTRTLNNLDDPIGFVTLASNQFTLPAGRYVLDGTACAYRVNGHQTRIRNITDSTDAILGTSGFSAGGVLSTDLTSSHSNFTGTINITGTKTFALQHFCNLSGSFGQPAGTGSNEQYSFIRIMKLF